mmetsp:Transcript_6319/g.11299  ORF Transcript_6319/g.11299 Transcript_6319/m.11299 type:complete len:295 (+) Transcript_6319:539-1423(+)
MRHHQHIVRGCQCHDTPCLSDSTKPGNIWLEDVRSLLIDELLEAPARIFMFTCSEHQAQIASSLHNLLVAVILVRWQEFLHPSEVQVRLGDTACKRDAVWHSESHVTIEHQREALSNKLSGLLAELDALVEALRAILGTEGARYLAAHESKLLANIWAGCRGVHGQDCFGGSTKKHVHWFIAELSKQVPKREVHCRDGLDGKTFPTVVDSGSKHLVPHELNVARILALTKAAQMVFHDVAASLATNGDSNAAGAIISLNLNDHAAHGIDSPGLSMPLVRWVNRHGVRYRQQLSS